jgi:SAM-dependent methyltransferase
VSDAARWNEAIEPLLRAPEEALWRVHSDAVNAKLFGRWLPERPCHRLLKTDLYDEAMGDGLYPMLAGRAEVVTGIDVSAATVAAATGRYPQLLAVQADVRRLPFASASFDVIVSNSTLDHFATRGDVERALRELHRILATGGALLLTLDNLANPAVALRNALPFSWLRRLRLVPYPVGATFGPRGLKALLCRVGFETADIAALLHCPRVFAIPLSRLLQRRSDARRQSRFLRHLSGWEKLSRWPSRFLTAYFVGVCARKAR